MRYALAFALGLAGGLAFDHFKVQEVRAESADRIATLEASVGAGCEPVYAAVWTTYECPPLVPAAAKPFVCASRPTVYRSAVLEKTLAKVRSLGTGAAIALFEEKGVKERELAVTWTPGVKD